MCPGEGSAQLKPPGAPDLPRGPGPSYILSGPLSGEGTDTPPEGVRSRHVSTVTGTQSFLGKTRPPTAFNAGDGSALCPSRARGVFSQAVLLIARYQGTQYSRWCHPRHARQSATPVRHDSSATEYHNAYTIDPTVYAATYTASTGISPMGQVKTPFGQRVYSAMKRIREEILNHCSTISVFLIVKYTSLLGPPVGVQRLCTCPPYTIKGGRPLENNSNLKSGLRGRG